MYRFAARGVGQLRERQRHEEADDGVHGEGESAPLDASCVERRLRVRGAEDVSRHGRNEEEPHAEEAQPGHELNDGELAHRGWHLANRAADVPEERYQPQLAAACALEGGHVLWRKLRRRENSP